MLAGPDKASVRHYVATGRQPLDAVGRALALAGLSWAETQTFLDFGAGYGRVLRWVRSSHPHVEVTAADINRQAVEFCAAKFGVTPLHVVPDVERLAIPGKYDVIWVGSVLTHLSKQDGVVLLSRLADALSPSGVLTFTTHGTLMNQRIPEYGTTVAAAQHDIRQALDQVGVYYLPEGRNAHAITFHAPRGVRALLEDVRPRLTVLEHVARGWDSHQDVWSCRLAGTAVSAASPQAVASS